MARKNKGEKNEITIQIKDAVKVICTFSLWEKLVQLGWVTPKEGGYSFTEHGVKKLIHIAVNERNARAVKEIVTKKPDFYSFNKMLFIQVVLAKLVSLGWLDENLDYTEKGINRLMRLYQRLPEQSLERIGIILLNQNF